MLAKQLRRYLYTMLTNLAHNLYDVMCVIASLIVKRHKAVLIRCEAEHHVAFEALHAAPSLSTKPTAPPSFHVLANVRSLHSARRQRAEERHNAVFWQRAQNLFISMECDTEQSACPPNLLHPYGCCTV